jgi:HEAT repeat protein
MDWTHILDLGFFNPIWEAAKENPGLQIAAIMATITVVSGGIYYFWSRHTVSGNLSRLNNVEEVRLTPYVKETVELPRSIKRRKTAVRALGKLGDKRAVEPLIEMLNSPQFALEAITALGKIKDIRAIEPLSKILCDYSLFSDYRREAAAGALGEIGHESAVGPLSKHGFHIEPEYRGYAFDPEIGKIPIDAPAQYHDEVRIAAAEALGKIGGERAIRALYSAYNPIGHHNVTYAKAIALGKLGHPELLISLLNVKRLGIRFARADAVKALRKLGGKRAIIPLLLSLGDEGNSARKKAIKKALRKLGDKRIINPFIKLMEDVGPEVRKATADVLGKLGMKNPLKRLLQKIYKRDDKEIISIGVSLGKLGYLELLIGLLKDQSFYKYFNKPDEIRVAASEALGKLGDKRAIPLLHSKRENESSSVKKAVDKALAQLETSKKDRSTKKFRYN